MNGVGFSLWITGEFLMIGDYRITAGPDIFSYNSLLLLQRQEKDQF